ncbi:MULTISPECIES: competence protein ComK [unclassified Bacillus (in: firmicutes)]|uniref:competence protein ComK n=1 Tax=unclassified Bacillus (in: firmicutes) TaxID=185979 RepID=UPI0015CF58D5|nr:MULTISPECIES: competence protein ComK [unclassified Bacillus (in: firmicutes)]
MNNSKGKVKVLNEYEINKSTMAIIPEFTVDLVVISKVLESNDNFYVLMKPIEIIERSCAYFGSSYRGRREGTKQMISITHKPPIAISSMNQIFFFPTSSSLKVECSWISYNHVSNFKGGKYNRSIVEFFNGVELPLDISRGSFENQLYRTAHLRAIYEDRLNQENAAQQRNYRLVPDKEITSYIKGATVHEK